ncbi:MAG TPA: hypothetical protein VIM11_10590 [Tepidisphaeraceae bacterium]|jgi:hypothetical protein
MGMFDFVSDAVDAVGGAISDAAGAVEGAAEGVVGAIAGEASSVVSAVESFGSDAFSVLKSGVGDVVNGVEDAAGAVEHAVEDAADATGSFIKKAAKYVGGEIEAAASGIWDGIKDVGEGIVGSVKDFAEGIVGGVGGFFSNLVQGHVGDAFQSLIDGADKAFIQGPQRLVNGVIDSVQDTLDGASHLLGPVGGVAREIIDRSSDMIRTATNTVIEAGRDVFRVATEVPLNFAADMYKVGDDLVHGNFKDAAKDFGGAFVHAGARIGGFVVDVASRGFQGIASIAQTATFLEPPSRKLTDDEKKLLREVYGDSVDLDSIRIKDGGALNNAMAPHTVGNTIYLPHNNSGKPLYDDKGNLTEYGKLIVHETGHVWQSQNAGGDYIAQSLYNQAKASIEGSSRNGAYDYASAIAAGKSFDELNPEQQAEYIEQVLGPILAKPGDAEANLAAARAAGLKDGQGNPIDYDYAETVLHDVLAGRAAA